MAKKLVGTLKLQIPAGGANPSPPVGPALGQRGINIMEFCKAFNAKTILVGLPQFALPMAVYYFGNLYYDHMTACLLVAGLGSLGIFLKPFAFNLIMKAYKSEKYSTLKAYKSN